MLSQTLRSVSPKPAWAGSSVGDTVYGQGPRVLELKSSGSGAEAGPEVRDPQATPRDGGGGGWLGRRPRAEGKALSALKRLGRAM